MRGLPFPPPCPVPARGHRKTFAVGRLTPRTTEIRLAEHRQGPVAGPFSLRAVVRGQ